MFPLVWTSLACSVVDPAVSAPPGNVDRVVHDHYRKWYRDADGDGHGDPDVWRRKLTRPPGHVANATDCDDHAATAYPGAEEICGNGDDDDCDSEVDDCTIAAADAELRIDGDTVNSAFANDIEVADVDVDGVADILMPDWLGDGTVYVLYGPASGVWASSSLVTLGTTTADAMFGFELDGGDVNGDGADDIVVGAIGSTVESAYVFLGPITADRDTTEAEAVFEGPAGSRTGTDVDIVPDFDGDGAIDLVVGANEALSDAGAVYVASGATSGTVDLATDATYVYEGDMSDELGWRNESLGDTNGDGITDLAIDARYDGAREEGAVYVVEGGATSGTYDVDAAATATIYGTAYADFGYALATPDYDADGTTDLLVGAFRTGWPVSYEAGAVYGFLGPLSGSLDTRDAAVTWTGDAHVAGLGIDVSAGDVDGDESVDVLMGAFWTTPGYGAAFLQFGLASGSVDVSTLLAVRGSGEFGVATSLVPDWTGDDGAELAVAARGVEDAAGEEVGAVYVIFSDALHF
jgi:hypothetical protein